MHYGGTEVTSSQDRALFMMSYFVELFQTWGTLSPSSALALGLFFAMAAFIVFPRTVFIVTAGATFGLWAAPIILVGGTAGCVLAFLLSRYVASNWVRRKLERKPELIAIARAVDDDGWRIIALMRLGVPVPGSLQNYLFGLTKIDLLTFAISTFIFTSPQIFLFTFLGATGRASLLDNQPLSFTIATIVLTVAIMALISWRVKQILRVKV
jgi:uncharacterized membrane protein YdjX (TVP38/TMEM64 family)